MSSVCSVCERPDSQEGAEAVECSADGEVHALENALRQGGRQGGQINTFIQCCGSGMFIPDPSFSIPDPESRIKKILDSGSGSASKN